MIQLFLGDQPGSEVQPKTVIQRPARRSSPPQSSPELAARSTLGCSPLPFAVPHVMQAPLSLVLWLYIAGFS